MLPFFSVKDFTDMAPQLDFEGLQSLKAMIMEEIELYDKNQAETINYVYDRCIDDLKHKKPC